MARSNAAVWVVALLLVGGAVAVALLRQRPQDGLKTRSFEEGRSDPQNPAAQQVIVPKNAPVVIEIQGDLINGGTKQQDGTVTPYVIGEVLELDAIAENATEYRWSVNGEPIDKDKEWSPNIKQEYEIKKAGEYRFAIQVRGSNHGLVSQQKEATVQAYAVFIDSFERNIVENDDRAVTGGEMTFETAVAEPVNDMQYRYRYWVNDAIIKHPEDGEEWTEESSLTYTFLAPGQYSFKVEVRRGSAKEAEASKELAETITAGDSVITSFEANPEKFASLGTSVFLDAWTESGVGKNLNTECRFGYKKFGTADYVWILDDEGGEWGYSSRNWLPTDLGNYFIRAEVREVGKATADDSREVTFTVTDTDAGF